MTPQELLEIEQAMAAGPWSCHNKNALNVWLVYPSELRLLVPDKSLGPDDPKLYPLQETEANALGIVAARNRLKDLAELWAWAEPAFKDIDSNHGSGCAAHVGQRCSCWIKPLEEILTRLRGE